MSHLPAHILEFDHEMQALEQDIAVLNTMLHTLQDIHKRVKKLEDYYYEGQWLTDVEQYPDTMIGVLSQDGLYNLLFQEQEKRKQILKYLAQCL